MLNKIDNALLGMGMGLVIAGVVWRTWWLIALGGVTVFMNVLTRVIMDDRRK